MNFRIIENAPPKYTERYEEFIELYNESNLTMDEIRKKLDWTYSAYRQARKKAVEEKRLKERNPSHKPKNKKIKDKPKYYHRTPKGKYIVHKHFYKEREIIRSVYGGIYKYEWQAQKVVEEFKKVDWDESKLQEIKEKVVNDDR